MKKKPYDVYSPEIYPRLLFVSTNIEDLDKYFIFLDVYGNSVCLFSRMGCRKYK